MQTEAVRYYLLAFWAITAPCSPTLAQYHLYWGDVHGHTRLSDGKGNPDDYFAYARDIAKLDFAIVTDHDFGNAAPWRMPKDAWTLIQDAVDQHTTNGEFIAIAGYEWTSQPKYWTGVDEGVSEGLFAGPSMFYNHKVVYFPARVAYLFSAKDPAYMTPDLLAAEVAKHGGLIHNAHPSIGPDGRDQFDYRSAHSEVIANTEIGADSVWYQGKTYQVDSERTVRGFLNHGGKTGFVKGTDSHEGKPAARTAVLARELTRAGIFEALRRRRCYAVSNARIVLEFQVDGHPMGEEIEVEGQPHLVVNVKGTSTVAEVAVIRNGVVARTVHPEEDSARLDYVDDAFTTDSYYYVRVTQTDTDEYGNRSVAWSSPIWVKPRH